MADRRTFLRTVAGLGTISATANGQRRGFTFSGEEPGRSRTTLSMREERAMANCFHPMLEQTSNGDETGLPGYIGCHTKGLPHAQSGLVEPDAYQSLLHAMSTGQHADFEAIDRGSGMKLVNPQSAFTYEMEGLDTHQLACPPAPQVSSPEAGAEMAELYWQAAARDVPFASYGTSALIHAASQDLNKFPGFQGLRQAGGTFRGPFAGCLDGPYISQFFYQPVPVNSTLLDQKYRVPVSGTDFMTDYAEWLLLQSGLPPYREAVYDGTPRYICNGRGLAEWVHYDFLYQAYHYAALILVNQSPDAILDTNPYYSPSNPYKNSKVQTGFCTFGAPHVCSWLGRVTTAALQAAWYQKWAVHRRLRPEEFGGLVHRTMTGSAKYPISPDLLNSGALAATYKATGSYLLPQAFPEGCPLHPSYPAGHATVSGAASIVLKAFFDENALVRNCMTANADGTALVPYDGALTVGGEINKLVWNVAFGRNFAGIHYRSDAMAGFTLGEDIAIAKLQDLVNIFTESFPGFQFTRLNGTPVTISKTTI